eukprot:3561399-Amphidinium_carterae.1
MSRPEPLFAQVNHGWFKCKRPLQWGFWHHWETNLRTVEVAYLLNTVAMSQIGKGLGKVHLMAQRGPLWAAEQAMLLGRRFQLTQGAELLSVVMRTVPDSMGSGLYQPRRAYSLAPKLWAEKVAP